LGATFRASNSSPNIKKSPNLVTLSVNYSIKSNCKIDSAEEKKLAEKMVPRRFIKERRFEAV
jgi:hypothetical protein